MVVAPWQKYVSALCTEAWDLDAAGTEAVLDRFDRLIHDGRVTDEAVVHLLRDAGVSDAAALMIAPSIRVSILA